jgi:hypothetical protein
MPTVTNQNIALVHRKEWQMMTPAPVASSSGSFVITDINETDVNSLYVVSATVHYLYNHKEDSYIQIPSGALAGSFGAGSCGARSRYSNTFTANGGSTTTVVTATILSDLAVGSTIRFLSGANLGKESLITGVIVIPGTSTTLQFGALSSAVVNNDTFVLDTGRFFIVNAGIVASGSFKSYDMVSSIWTTLGITNLPSIVSDSRLVVTPSNDVFATGFASSATTTTLTNTPKTWTVNQWTNYQIRITAGTGIGQIRTISSNTANVLTVSTAFTITPDVTSSYELTGNDDNIYFLGNGAVTMYKYSISSNTWVVMAPTTARGGLVIAGMSANWSGISGDINRYNESNIQDGRYIYSFRGGSGTLDRFDIAGGASGAGAWLNIAYNGLMETFNTGSAYALSNEFIYIRKDATHRYFKFSITGSYIYPLTTNLYPDSTALVGDKIWIKNYTENGVVKLTWLYSLRNSATELHRILLF